MPWSLDLRILRRDPGLALAIVGTLALGFGATLAVFTYLKGMLLAGLPYEDPDRLVRVESRHGGVSGKLSQLEVRELNRTTTLFEGFAGFRPTQYTVNADQDPVAIPATVNTWNLFSLLGVQPMLGGTWPESDDGAAQQFAVVISHQAWQSHFGGDRDIVGRVITLDRSGYTVLGVMPPGFDFPGDAQVFRRVPARDYDGRFIRNASVVARLRPGVALAAAQAELDAIARLWAAEFPETNAGLTLVARPIREFWIGRAAPLFRLLLVAAGLVVVLAGINATTLLLARVRSRRREWAMRSALGADPGRLFRSLAVECIALSLGGAVAGLILAWLTTRALTRLLMLAAPGWMHLGLDGWAVLLALVLAVVIGLGVCLSPWLETRRLDLTSTLREGGRSVAGPDGARSGLVALQFTLAFALVAITLTLSTHVKRLERTPLGFSPEGLLTLKIDPPGSQFSSLTSTAPLYRRIVEALERVPGVQAVAANDYLPLAVSDPAEAVNTQLPQLEGQSATDAERNGFLTLQNVSPGYFEVMGIALERGRTLVGTDDSVAPIVGVVSVSLARRLWGQEDPLGRRLRTVGLGGNYRPAQLGADSVASPWITVVGVVADIRQGGALGEPGADLYLSNLQLFVPETYLMIRGRGDTERLLPAVREAIRQVDATQAVFDVRPMSARVKATIWRQRLASVLLQCFGLLALCIAGVGLFGLMRNQVAQQRRALGVRLALGAEPRQLLVSVLRQAGVLAGIGLVAGSLIVLLLSPVVTHTLPGLAAPSLADGTVAGLTLLLLALAAALVPAVTAARLDPVEILRDD